MVNDPHVNQAGDNEYARLLTTDINSTTVGGQPARQVHEEVLALIADLGIEGPVGGAVNDGVEGFGSTPELYRAPDVGDILVVRADGLPLLRTHLEALCEYIRQQVAPLLRAATLGLNPGDVVDQREESLNRITRASFLEFWNAYAEERVADVVWAYPASPYHTAGPELEQLRNVVEEIFQQQQARRAL